MKFYFYLDQKVTTWMRTNFDVDAENYDEAVKLAKQTYESGDLTEYTWEEVGEIKEVLEVNQNEGNATEEIYHEDGSIIYKNTQL